MHSTVQKSKLITPMFQTKINKYEKRYVCNLETYENSFSITLVYLTDNIMNTPTITQFIMFPGLVEKVWPLRASNGILDSLLMIELQYRL